MIRESIEISLLIKRSNWSENIYGWKKRGKKKKGELVIIVLVICIVTILYGGLTKERRVYLYGTSVEAE